MNLLEERYRAWLRLLPASYRAMWEEDMVATFLDGVSDDGSDSDDSDEVYAGLAAAEIRAVVALAVRVRLDGLRQRLGPLDAPPRSALWGDGVRVMALVALLMQAALAALSLADWLWTTGRLPWLAPPRFVNAVDMHVGGWSILWNSGFPWLCAYFALVYGYRRIAQGLVLLVVVPSAVIAVSRLSLWATLPRLDGAGRLAAAVLLFVVPAVPLVAGFHRDAPPVRRGWWLPAFPVAVACALGAVLVSYLAGDSFPVDEAGLYSVLFVAAAGCCMVLRGRAAVAPAVAVALALLAPVVLGLRLATLWQYHTLPGSRFLAVGVWEAIAVAAVAVPLTCVATLSMRRVPADRQSAAMVG